ncbi:MAG: glycolate oxidase subunit GlcE [Methylococcaceae bacterium]|nr:glycolate oxidase subunit GlcE [Methylococcaceae bacterium]
MQNQDLSESLRDRVLDAAGTGTPLNIVAGGSKAFYGRRIIGEDLELAGHRGIVFYEPTELVITARAGTPLAIIEAELAKKKQMLGFEPPYFGPNATLGGTVACGLSGPRRPYAGAVRDFILGVKLLNGRGEILSFGGRVMKNVAGFDLSRLMAGALGTLGPMLEISLKVLPKPEVEETSVFELPAEKALEAMNRWAGQNWPLSASCHDGKRLYLRLSGSGSAIKTSREKLGGEALSNGAEFWADLREQRLPFFAGKDDLWRLSLAPASSNLPGSYFIDWGGALRWLKTDAPAESLFTAASRAGGHATLFRSRQKADRVFQPLPEGLKQIHIKLKKAFDPKGIFNPGRMYEGM